MMEAKGYKRDEDHWNTFIMTMEQYDEFLKEFYANCTKDLYEACKRSHKWQAADGTYWIRTAYNRFVGIKIVEEEQDDDAEISEEMISNFREFKNVAYFNITVDGTRYPVVAEYHHQTIETEAPIKEALRKWYFMVE